MVHYNSKLCSLTVQCIIHTFCQHSTTPQRFQFLCLLSFYAFPVKCVIILFMTSVKSATRYGNLAEKMK